LIARPAVRPALILGVTLLTALSSIVEAPSQVRLVLLLGFLTFLPGLSLLALFPPRDLVSGIALAVGLSLALDLLIVSASMYSGAFSPANLLMVLLAVTFVVSAGQLAGGLGLVTWPSISLGPDTTVAGEHTFTGWYQVTSGPYKGMWTKSALWPQADRSAYPGASLQLAPSTAGASSAELTGTAYPRTSPHPGFSLADLSAQPPPSKPPTRTRILSITSPVSRGGRASLIANTTPYATCHLVVYYGSGPTRVAGSGDRQADADGDVSWSWRVGTRTSPGTWTIDVICDPGGSTSATLTVS
jgi:hypothetical protein